MPKPPLRSTFRFEPPWKIPRKLPDPDAGLLEKVEKAFHGFRRFVLYRKAKNPKEHEPVNAGTYIAGSYGVAPVVRARAIAAAITAIATEHATRQEERVPYLVHLFGHPPPDHPDANMRISCTFVIDGRPEEEEEEDEDDAEGDGDEEEEEEEEGEGDDDDNDDGEGDDDDDDDATDDDEDDDTDEELEEIVSSPDPPDNWYPADPSDATQRPRSYAPYGPGAYRPGVQSELVKPLTHVPAQELATAFPAQPSNGTPSPSALPATAMMPGAPPMYPGYAMPAAAAPGYQNMHPGQALFMHHLGGVMAESRMMMEWFRQDHERQAGRVDKMFDKLQEAMQLKREDHERQARENREAFTARQDAMKSELEMLKSVLEWRTKIMQLEYEKKDSERDAAQKAQLGAPSWWQIASMLAPLAPGFIGQIVHHVRGRSGEAPPLVTQDTLALLSTMMGGGGQMMPMDPNAPPPGFIPPGGAPYGAPPGMVQGMPMQGMPMAMPGMPMQGMPMPASPEPSYAVTMAPPFGASPPVPTPAPAEPAPQVVDPRAAFETSSAPPPPTPGNGHLSTPPEPSASAPSTAEHSNGNGSPVGSAPSWQAAPLSQPPAPAPANSQPSQAELRARFEAGPLSAMCWMLRQMTTDPTASRIRQGGGAPTWDLICQAAAAPNDQAALPALLELSRVIDTPQGLMTILPHFDTERVTLLCDLRNSIFAMIAQAQAMATGQPGPWGPVGTAPQPPSGPAQPQSASDAPPFAPAHAVGPSLPPSADMGTTIPVVFGPPASRITVEAPVEVVNAEVITSIESTASDELAPEQEDGSTDEDGGDDSAMGGQAPSSSNRAPRRGKRRKRRG